MTPKELKQDAAGKNIYRYTTHRRTITETDIVNFVNLVGLHEPPFIDMEFIKTAMPPSHQKRFAPAPLLISLGMGLVAPIVVQVVLKISEEEKLGFFSGMVGVEARILKPVYPGDTLYVDLEASVDRKTSKGGTLVNLRHLLKNQDAETVVDFTEKVLFTPA